VLHVKGIYSRGNLEQIKSEKCFGDTFLSKKNVKYSITILVNNQNNSFCQLLNVHEVNDVRQTETRTAELLIPLTTYYEISVST
jgi:hypothetical protein